jgi:hypothetical protein
VAPTVPPPVNTPSLNLPPGGPNAMTVPPPVGGLGGGFGGFGGGGGGVGVAGGGGGGARSIPAAAAPVSGPSNLAPARLPPGVSPLTTAGPASGAGGMPPMMPPMGGGHGMGAGGSGSEPGSGAAKRPITKGKRRDEGTPGLPSMLAGRSESPYAPAYPAVSTPVTASEVPTTLDIVDEDLWQPSEGAQSRRRLP